jgi:DNA polymerase-1
MLRTFAEGKDIHWEMAKDIFHLPKDMKQDKDIRRRAKIILLGMMYGLTKYGLAKQLNCTVNEAAEHIESFFSSHPKFRMWIPRQRDAVYKEGLVRTLSGRRQIINPNNWQWQNHALNTPIQGSAADEIKLALAWLHAKYGTDLPVDAVVHDEILAESKKRQTKAVTKDIVAAFTFAANKLTPHVTTEGLVDVHIGKCWADKEG